MIPLCPEPIIQQKGEAKKGYERKAFERFLADLKREHPRLQLTLVSDALLASAPPIAQLTALGYDYIITVKAEGNRSLFEEANGIKTEMKMSLQQSRYTSGTSTAAMPME